MVGVGVAIGALVGLEIFLAEALLETRGTRKALETQAGGGGPMEESGLVAQTIQTCRHATERVGGVGGGYKRLH